MSYSFSATRGISEVSPRPLRPGRRALRRVPWRLQTYRNILYLLASFPLGLCYFVFFSIFPVPPASFCSHSSVYS